MELLLEQSLLDARRYPNRSWRLVKRTSHFFSPLSTKRNTAEPCWLITAALKGQDLPAPTDLHLTVKVMAADHLAETDHRVVIPLGLLPGLD